MCLDIIGCIRICNNIKLSRKFVNIVQINQIVFKLLTHIFERNICTFHEISVTSPGKYQVICQQSYNIVCLSSVKFNLNLFLLHIG